MSRSVRLSEYESDKFLVVKWGDARDHLSEQELTWLRALCNKIQQKREALGKSPHSAYFVCNQDEPYADKVLEVILQGEKDNEK